MHATKLGSPFVKAGGAHAMLAAKLRHRNPAFGLFQYAHDLSVAIFGLFHQNLLIHYGKRNSTFKRYYFRGGLPHQTAINRCPKLQKLLAKLEVSTQDPTCNDSLQVGCF